MNNSHAIPTNDMVLRLTDCFGKNETCLAHNKCMGTSTESHSLCRGGNLVKKREGGRGEGGVCIEDNCHTERVIT